jgi:hypothetical protein
MKTKKATKTAVKKAAQPQPAVASDAPAKAAVKATKSKFDGKVFHVVAELASKIQKESAMGQFVARGLALSTFGRNDICPPAECQTSAERMTQTARFEQCYRKGIVAEVPSRRAKKEAKNA